MEYEKRQGGYYVKFDIDLYRSLFVNRNDVFAVQQPKGMYFPERRPLINDDVQRHLDGEWSIGTYAIDPSNQSVSNIVFDLDILDEEAATTLCQLAEQLVSSVTPEPQGSLMREFSGNKGTHVWLFLSEPVPAEKVRRWIAADFMPKWQEIAGEKGWPTALEVFPKQDRVDPDGFGNLVKLPFGVHAVSENRSTPVPYKDWPTDIEDVWPLDAELVPEREHVGPVRHNRIRRERDGQEETKSPFACIDEIMHNGVGSGMRDNAMFHLALYLNGHGFTEQQALESCLAANDKFDPPMGEREVEVKVNAAFSGRYESAGCGADWLKGFCPGPCQQNWHVSGRKTKAGILDSIKENDAIEVEIISITSLDGRKRITLRHPDALNNPTLVVKGNK
jgi:hypothetical protein